MDRMRASTAHVVCAICNHDAWLGAPCTRCGHFTCPECGIPLIEHKLARASYKCIRCQSVYGVRLVVTVETGTYLAWPEAGE